MNVLEIIAGTVLGNIVTGVVLVTVALSAKAVRNRWLG